MLWCFARFFTPWDVHDKSKNVFSVEVMISFIVFAARTESDSPESVRIVRLGKVRLVDFQDRSSDESLYQVRHGMDRFGVRGSIGPLEGT